IRQGRASEAQIDVMINYFCLHPHVANNKLKGMLGKKELQGSWEELTNTLNAMFKNGKKKSVDSWKTKKGRENVNDDAESSKKFYLFPKVKKYHADVDTIKRETTKLLKRLTKEDIQHCFQVWKKR
ncbi:hypothetical protein ALC62_01973, partial [Cyphomyrmex costatus]